MVPILKPTHWFQSSTICAAIWDPHAGSYSSWFCDFFQVAESKQIKMVGSHIPCHPTINATILSSSFLPLETNLLAEMWKTQKHARLYCSGMGCIQILSNSPSKWCQHAVPPSEAAMNQRCPTRKTWHEKVPAILLGKIMENQRVTVLPLNSIIATNTTTG